MRTINFLRNGKNLKSISIEFDQFIKLPISIQKKLYKIDNYEIESNVESDVLSQFIDYLFDEQKVPIINSSTAHQYEQLFQEFDMSNIQIDSNFLDKMHLSILSYGERPISNFDKRESENYLALNLDHYLDNYFQEMYEIPFSILFNIFNSPSRILNNQNKAYEFITQLKRTNKDQNLFLLISSLHSRQLSPDVLNDCFSKQSEHFNILPQIDTSFLNSLANEANQEAVKYQAQIEIIKQQYETEINKIKQELEVKINEMKQQYDAKFSEMSQQYETKINEINQNHEAQIDRLTSLLPSQSSLDQAIASELMLAKLIKRLKNGYITAFHYPLLSSIPNSCFYDCNNLLSIIIPNSVTSIGDSAFFNCSNLTQIEIPNSVTSIGKSAFYGCYNLTQIEIPNSVKSIGDSAFRNCSNLTQIEIPNSVTSIGKSAFYGCSILQKSSNFVRRVGKSAF